MATRSVLTHRHIMLCVAHYFNHNSCCCGTSPHYSRSSLILGRVNAVQDSKVHVFVLSLVWEG